MSLVTPSGIARNRYAYGSRHNIQQASTAFFVPRELCVSVAEALFEEITWSSSDHDHVPTLVSIGNPRNTASTGFCVDYVYGVVSDDGEICCAFYCDYCGPGRSACEDWSGEKVS